MNQGSHRALMRKEAWVVLLRESLCQVWWLVAHTYNPSALEAQADVSS